MVPANAIIRITEYIRQKYKAADQMVSIYLCEDEALQLSYFEKMIKKYISDSGRDAELISARRSPEQTLADAKEHGSGTGRRAPSLFLIDIRLKGSSMDGFALAREVKRCVKDCYLVFLTSREELAYKAFEYELGISDYIVKRPEDFLEDHISDSIKRRLDNIFDRIDRESDRGRKESFSIECGSRRIEVEKSSIILIQSLKRKHQSEICTDSQRLTTDQPLAALKERLGEDFIYISRSCIVQKRKIVEIDKKNRFITLEGGYQAEVSFRRLPLLLEKPGDNK